MNIELSPQELRAIGCLIEKQLTTPEQYPLSLNALTNACNQKSNRDPVMELTEVQVQGTLDTLSRKHLVIERAGFGSRVPKYQQRFCNTEFSVFQFTPQERAIVCELLLRGAQTPGELRSRAARMASFTDAQEVEQALEALSQRQGGALVRREPLEPGRREARYQHLFGDRTAARTAQTPSAAAPLPPASVPAGVAPGSAPEPAAPVPRLGAGAEPPTDWARRLSLLEQQLGELRAEVAALKRGG
ncbi:MAG TPA: DUF480 domain-containing protein [Steroidobacteraceae bacterium]|jgi:hypothetical protein|nr:DUF480 domain-containing protein [Steroidobacteraceae bacterium]